ncbi:glycoside hydrolase family 35 protein [Streptomyces sp. YU58]|uniref:glycoside hydrolase family 35 protein n=1 Tax=Streptomyces sp. SX92 TaxID=3158972 RepID=UPI0027B9E827|nr:beta-galactosidase [Streptomyces coralus]WLW57995.1 beta-galactosidase [Streptomyces coralus]
MELTRRTFATLAGGGAGLAVPAAADPSAAADVPDAPSPSADGAAHTVAFGKYSVLIDGRRAVLRSGEIHPFRLPSPSLWRDVLQKLRAHGLNTVGIYVAWNYHSPAPGRYDFTGVRDLDLFLRMAAEEGLYVIVRPGPYTNSETDGGGFPGWPAVTKGRARTDDPTYLSYADEYLTAVNEIVARHQYTRGEGTVVLYQLENEYAALAGTATGSAYMAHLYAKVRADGIDVPLFHNDFDRNGRRVPGSFDTGGESSRWLYAFDGYPDPAEPAPDWGCFGVGGQHGGSTASPGTPGFIAEFGGGWFDPWGGAPFSGKGYEEVRRTRDTAYLRRFCLTNLANGIKIHNIYMVYGGTSCWLPAPIVYTSYDYGAAIDEARNVTPKMMPMHQIGQLLHSVPDLAKLDRAPDVTAAGLKTYHLTNPDTGAHVYVLRNDSAERVSPGVPLALADGTTVTPAVTVGAHDAKLIAAGITLAGRKPAYSTVQPMLAVGAGRRGVAVFAGRAGEPAEVAFAYESEPEVTVLDGAASSAYADGRLTLKARLDGLTRVSIGDSYLVLFAADDTSARLWRHDTPSGPVLVRGPALLRTARLKGTSAHLTGDTVEDTDLEVWAPRGVQTVTWNGEAVRVHATASGSLAAKLSLPGAADVVLPALTGRRHRAENPEAQPDFDDSGWTVADKTSSYSTTSVPAGGPVLFADDYGFHCGDVWYRGSFDDAREAESVKLAYSTGTQGLLMAWLDGRPLGTHRMPVRAASESGRGTWAAEAGFSVPPDLRTSGGHVLSVLVRRMQHEQDGWAADTHKAARGPTAVTFTGVTPTVTWRLQGEAGSDRVRGPLNTGGLYGERHGWHLPGPGAGDWAEVGFPLARRRQGVDWYRTTFRLGVDHDTDASIGITFTDDATRAYRVQLYVNGWNMGQYINDAGPQHTFVVPGGILRTRGRNTLALAVLSDGTTPAGPGEVTLTLLGRAAGGVKVEPVESPGA